MQYDVSFHGTRNALFQLIICSIFLIFASKMDCRYSLETPQCGGSNEYPQFVFLSQNKEIIFSSVKPTFPYLKLGFPGCSLAGLVNVVIDTNTFTRTLKLRLGDRERKRWSPNDWPRMRTLSLTHTDSRFIAVPLILKSYIPKTRQLKCLNI